MKNMHKVYYVASVIVCLISSGAMLYAISDDWQTEALECMKELLKNEDISFSNIKKAQETLLSQINEKNCPGYYNHYSPLKDEYKKASQEEQEMLNQLGISGRKIITTPFEKHKKGHYAEDEITSQDYPVLKKLAALKNNPEHAHIEAYYFEVLRKRLHASAKKDAVKNELKRTAFQAQAEAYSAALKSPKNKYSGTLFDGKEYSSSQSFLAKNKDQENDLKYYAQAINNSYEPVLEAIKLVRSETIDSLFELFRDWEAEKNISKDALVKYQSLQEIIRLLNKKMIDEVDHRDKEFEVTAQVIAKEYFPKKDQKIDLHDLVNFNY